MMNDHDFDLGIPGFRYSHLHLPDRLHELLHVFWKDVEVKAPALWAEYQPYLAARGADWSPIEESPHRAVQPPSTKSIEPVT